MSCCCCKVQAGKAFVYQFALKIFIHKQMIRPWNINYQLKLFFNHIETLILWPSDLLSKEAAHLSTWPWDTTKVLLSFWLLYYYFSSYMVPKVPHHKHFLHKSSIESNLFLQDNDNFLEFPFSYHLNINHMSLYYYQQNCKSKKSRYTKHLITCRMQMTRPKVICIFIIVQEIHESNSHLVMKTV